MIISGGLEVSSFVNARTIENYLDGIRLKSKGTVRNIGNYLKIDDYLQERILFDILQDFVNDLSTTPNHLRNNSISLGYVRHVVYEIRGILGSMDSRLLAMI